DDDAILVGHSLGGTILINAIAKSRSERQFGAIFLIAAPFVGDGGWPSEDMNPPPDLGARLPRDVPVFIYHGLDDDTAPPSNADQQIPLRRRWSSSTRSRIAAGSRSRCQKHSRRPARSPSPFGAAARAALIAYAAAPSSWAATWATAAAWPAACAACLAAPDRSLAAALAWPAAERA